MEITSTTLILIGVICILLGFLASSLLNTLRSDEVPPAEEDAQAPPGGKKGRYFPVVRIWREKKSGAIVVESGGKSYVNAVPLDETQHEELESIAREFRGWLGMGITNSAAKMEGTDIPSARQTSIEKTDEAIPPNPGVVNIKAVQKPAVSRPVVPGATPEVVPPLGSKSIVMQIEDILQDMISSSPSANRHVHLYEDPQRGVVVKVGDEIYEGIDMVPDSEVKALIRSAVAAWEKNQ